MNMIFKSPDNFESIYIANKLLNIVFFEEDDRYFTIVGNHYLVDSSKLISIYIEILIFHIYIYKKDIIFYTDDEVVRDKLRSVLDNYLPR